MDQERRRAPRFPFIASAEVLSESAGTRLAARISDISATGCYVDTINPLVGGTPVRVKILTETHLRSTSYGRLFPRSSRDGFNVWCTLAEFSAGVAKLASRRELKPTTLQFRNQLRIASLSANLLFVQFNEHFTSIRRGHQEKIDSRTIGTSPGCRINGSDSQFFL
jgi:hypothetical protein